MSIGRFAMRAAIPVGATLAAFVFSGWVNAQSAYPSRQMTMVVPFAAGGPTDILGRILAQDMATRLGQPIVVENRPGATGIIGLDIVSKSPPDGHTLAVMANTSTNQYHLVGRAIDFTKDFALVGNVYSTYSVLMVNPNATGMADVRNLAQLLAYAKANPAGVNFTSAGAGSLGHLTMEKVRMQFGVKIEHVSYKGLGPATNDVLAGRVPVLASTYSAIPLIQAGKLRAIAVGTPKRSSLLPEVPTFIEQGVPEMISAAWVGITTSGGTPAPIVARLGQELGASLAKPEVAERITKAVGVAPEFMGPAEFTAFATRDWQYWGRVIRDSGIKIER